MTRTVSKGVAAFIAGLSLMAIASASMAAEEANRETAVIKTNCKYVLGTATTPDGQTFELSGMDPVGAKALRDKGYSQASEYEADMMLAIRSRAATNDSGDYGSYAKVLMRKLITGETVVEAEGNFAPAPNIDVLSAIQNLEACPK